MEKKMKTRPDLLFIALLSLLALVPAGQAERHSLTYIYTAFSKPTSLLGIHEFTAMGLVDNTMIDYFDSDIKQKVPKQPWMKENMAENYWEKGTQSRLSKQTWFRVNIDILIERMRQDKNETHILQWMHGCESITENGETKFLEGKDTYSYDGKNFLHFDDKDGLWISSSKAAEDTRRKWDGVQTLKDYTKGYLEKECLDWLNKFVEFGRKQQQDAPLPEMFLFAKKSRTESNVILTCLASGFLQKDAQLLIRRNGRLLDEVDGVRSSGVRPNNDDTYQRRQCVEIFKSDESVYTCEVVHQGSGLKYMKTWDRKLPDEGSGLIMIVVVVVGVLLILIGIIVGGSIWYFRGGKCVSKRTVEIEARQDPFIPPEPELEPLNAQEDARQDPFIPPAPELEPLHSKAKKDGSGSLGSGSDSGVSADGGSGPTSSTISTVSSSLDSGSNGSVSSGGSGEPRISTETSILVEEHRQDQADRPDEEVPLAGH